MQGWNNKTIWLPTKQQNNSVLQNEYMSPKKLILLQSRKKHKVNKLLSIPSMLLP